MVGVKFTKNELRDQQIKLLQLQKYLPTLQLKKAMLQVQAGEVRAEIAALSQSFVETKKKVDSFSFLLLKDFGLGPEELVKSSGIKKSYENIAGVEIPRFEGIDFEELEYNLFETPIWLDGVVMTLRFLIEQNAKIMIAEEKKAAIEKELREVSIRVNLFEKVMIPQAQENIKIIKVFLGDQQLAAVARAKVAKTKIEAKKKRLRS